MASTMRSAVSTREVNSLDSIRPEPVKASLPVNDGQSDLRTLIGEAIRRAGSQKAAASDMRMDPAQLTRQLQNGHLTVERLEALPPTFALEFGKLLTERFGPLATPKARIQAKARELREMAAEFDQLAEFIA